MKKKKSGRNPVLSDLKFAYRHLRTPDEEIPQVRRQEARNMLQWARANTVEFMRLLIRTSKEEEHEESKGPKDIGTEEALAVVSELLSEYNLSESVKSDDVPRHEKVRKMREQGYRTKDIAQALGITTRTVQKDYQVIDADSKKSKGKPGSQATPAEASGV